MTLRESVRWRVAVRLSATSWHLCTCFLIVCRAQGSGGWASQSHRPLTPAPLAANGCRDIWQELHFLLFKQTTSPCVILMAVLPHLFNLFVRLLDNMLLHDQSIHLYSGDFPYAFFCDVPVTSAIFSQTPSICACWNGPCSLLRRSFTPWPFFSSSRNPDALVFTCSPLYSLFRVFLFQGLRSNRGSLKCINIILIHFISRLLWCSSVFCLFFPIK